MSVAIVAHCGDVQHCPESTLPAFGSAIQRGADVIEFDVHLTADEEVVIHHFYYLGTTNNGTGYISDYRLDELRQLDAGSWYSPEFAGVQIPTFKEVLVFGRGQVRFQIDLKTPDIRLVHKVVEIIEQAGVINDVQLTSPQFPLLFHLKQYAPHLPIGTFFMKPPLWMKRPLAQLQVLQTAHLMNLQYIHLNIDLIDRSFVASLKEQGYKVHGSNLNTITEMQHALRAGVDQFSTDLLEVAFEQRYSFDTQNS